ncbi:hypothetical protein ACFQ0T_29300 [Kitasatospora gansuensis]
MEREVEERHRREEAHRAEQARMEEFLRDGAAQRRQAEERPEEVQSAKAKALEVARGARQRSKYYE